MDSTTKSNILSTSKERKRDQHPGISQNTEDNLQVQKWLMAKFEFKYYKILINTRNY